MTQTAAQGKATIDQQRAKHAWNAAQQLRLGSDEADDYAREAKKLPVRMITSGLGHALAFLNAKKAKKRGLEGLIKDLDDWASRRLRVQQSLLEAIMQGDSDFLRRATDEMLAYLAWLNRFTEGRGLPKKGEQD